ncbi:hypothetical protein GDO86_018270 [Hymenochirus boettgeri]|uniref:Uncharacterized protein n=1 Tax=Hymenochirus boettgeri TaxID=247094 RepID=A0A8T2IG90_9PIPI|nr:hypothetical protein GDO86_018270 [Hymenochirus boettgeri]
MPHLYPDFPCNHGFLSFFQYDFLLEKKTIHWAEEIKQIKDAQKDAELKAKAVHCQSDLEAISGSECDKSVNVAPSINPFLATLQHNNILTPTPANSSISKVTSPPHLKADFNPADFECEEDPFDKLELKTIDDKEELKSILNVHVKPVSHPDSPPDDQEQSVDSSAKELDISTPSKPEDLDIKLPPKPNGLINLPQLQNCELIPTSSTVSLAPITSVSNIKSLSFPKLDSDEGDQTMSQLPSTFHSTTCLSNGTFLDTLKNNSPRNSSELNGHHSLGPSLLHLDPLVLPVIPPFTATQIPTSGTEEISRISPNNGSRVR